MKGTRELKTRLNSVTNIRKITRAMELVAATKLRRLQDRALATRPFADRIESMMRRVAVHADAGASPLLAHPETVSREAVVVVGADRGLCGSYNSNIHREARRRIEVLRAQGVTPCVYAFGRRAQSFLSRDDSCEQGTFWDVPMEKLVYGDIKRAMSELITAFVEGKVQNVSVIYTRMESMARFTPTVQPLLPVARPEDAEADASADNVDYLLEPSPEAILRSLLPRYLEMQLYAAVLDALACEFAARRAAMKNATDNAGEMITDIRMEYNKARQAGITAELLDISGAVVSAEG